MLEEYGCGSCLINLMGDQGRVLADEKLFHFCGNILVLKRPHKFLGFLVILVNWLNEP
jgi:hypothetical protein